MVGSGRDAERGSGPVYDRAMRRLAVADLSSFCRLLDVPLEETAADGTRQVVLGSRFPSGDLDADLLVRVGPAAAVTWTGCGRSPGRPR